MTPTSLYRYFDKGGKLLYVGISRNALYRLGQHKRRSEWFNAIKTVSIDTFPTRETALAEEEKAFNDEHPKFGRSDGRDAVISRKENQERVLMANENREELLTTVDAVLETIGPDRAPLKRQLEAVAHKVRFPMRDILAKVPGDNLAARARKLKVSRQTMYVWMSEKFRPTVPQAIQIWRMTGIPVEHIVDDGFEATYVAEQQAGKKTARVATRRQKAASLTGGAAPRRRGASADKHRTDEA